MSPAATESLRLKSLQRAWRSVTPNVSNWRAGFASGTPSGLDPLRQRIGSDDVGVTARAWQRASRATSDAIDRDRCAQAK